MLGDFAWWVWSKPYAVIACRVVTVYHHETLKDKQGPTWRIPWAEEPGRLQWGHKESDTAEGLNNKLVIALGWRRWVISLRHGVSFWDDENVLRLLVENSSEYTKNHVYSFEWAVGW